MRNRVKKFAGLIVAVVGSLVVVPGVLAADVTPTVDTPLSFRATFKGLDSDPQSIAGNDFQVFEFDFWTVLVNLRGDAVDGNGTIEVVARAANGFVEVRVLDSGPGIAPEHVERIWEPDFTTKSRGTGLGLALVRQTVQAHGGKVGARNRPEGGAEFRVVLPIAATPASVAGNAG